MKRKETTAQTFVQQCIDICARVFYFYMCWRCNEVKKSISISIRVSEEELDKFKQAARLEAYASYSEFVRRTALIEAAKIIKKNENEGAKADECN